LPEAVASVTRLQRSDLELIVVDDGSSDESTSREMEALIRRGIRVVRQENKGLAAARNAGIQASVGKYILPLDADDHLRRAAIEHGIRILDAQPNVGVVYGDLENFGVLTGRLQLGAFDPNRLLRWNYIPCTAIYRRAVWEQNRGYDGAMPVQGLEDWDFWLEALEHGWDFAYVSEVFFDYRRARVSMLTRTHGFEKRIGDFIALKHARMYRQAFDQLAGQQQSLKWAARHLAALITRRLRPKLRR
jgi:glycosyltransferase involved in cell wall biosynthesis